MSRKINLNISFGYSRDRFSTIQSDRIKILNKIPFQGTTSFLRSLCYLLVTETLVIIADT